MFGWTKDVTPTRATKVALVLFGSLILAACSHKTLRVFFDVPPPDESAEAVTEVATEPDTGQSPAASNVNHSPAASAERPPLAIEETLDLETALALLPKDSKGQPDWSQALRDGVIDPLPLNAYSEPGQFSLDFHLQAAKPKFDAWFPHSAHTTILSCDNCHGTIFKYRSNEMSMKSLRKGEHCGACHGKVAFDLKACKRCHLAM